MPTDGFSMCMPIIIINSKLREDEQDSVPYMMKGSHRTTKESLNRTPFGIVDKLSSR